MQSLQKGTVVVVLDERIHFFWLSWFWIGGLQSKSPPCSDISKQILFSMSFDSCKFENFEGLDAVDRHTKPKGCSHLSLGNNDLPAIQCHPSIPSHPIHQGSASPCSGRMARCVWGVTWKWVKKSSNLTQSGRGGTRWLEWCG